MKEAILVPEDSAPLPFPLALMLIQADLKFDTGKASLHPPQHGLQNIMLMDC